MPGDKKPTFGSLFSGIPSGASTSGSNAPDGTVPGKSKSTKRASGFWQGNSAKAGTVGFQPDQSPTLKSGASGTNQVPALLLDSPMSPNAAQTTSPSLTLFAADFPAKTYRWLDAALDWLDTDPDSSSSSCVSLLNSLPVGFSSRTSLAFCRRTKDGTWEPSSLRWGNSGMGGPTACLTLNTSEWPKDAVVCSLSDVLETREVPQKFYLSPKAAQGILRRAERRERELPPALKHALQTLAYGNRGGVSPDGDIATLNSGGNAGGFRTEPGEHLVANTLNANYGRTTDAAGAHGTGPKNLVTEPQTFDWQGAGSDRTWLHDEPGRAWSLGASKTLAVHTVASTLTSGGNPNSNAPGRRHEDDENLASLGSTVRRLTPRECERLQGFPDDWTAGESDSARYRQLGNAVSVPVARWLAERILGVHQGM